MSTAASVNIIKQAARTAGAVLPPALAADLAKLDVHMPSLGNPRHDLANAVTNAVLDGKDPAASKPVQAALMRYQLVMVNPDNLLRDTLEERRADTIRAHAPLILAAFATVVDTLQAAVTAAREAGVTDYGEGGAHGLRADMLPLWGRVREALPRVEAAVQAWTQLAQLVGGVDRATDRRWRALVLAELSADQLAEANRTQRTDARTLAEDGHDLSLPTWEQWHARLARVSGEVTHAEQAREQAAQQAMANRYGSGRDIRPA